MLPEGGCPGTPGPDCRYDGLGCKEQVTPGLDCFSHEVVNLSIMTGSSGKEDGLHSNVNSHVPGCTTPSEVRVCFL